MQRFKKGSSLMIALMLALTIPMSASAYTIGYGHGCPFVTKEVKDNDNNEWVEVTDYQIGENVQFRMIGTLPENIRCFKNYKYEMTDMYTRGFTFNNDVRIKINDTENELPSEYYTVDNDEKSRSVSIDVNLTKAVEDGVLQLSDKLYAYYTSKLNRNAQKDYSEGSSGNITYNVVLKSGDIETTPSSVTYTYTYEVNVGHVRYGAEYELSRDGKPINVIKTGDGQYTISDDENSADNTTTIVRGHDAVSIFGLDKNVKYTLTETKAPEGEEELYEPTEFKIYATYNTEWEAQSVYTNNKSVNVNYYFE